VELYLSKDGELAVVDVQGRIAPEEVGPLVEILEQLPEKGQERVAVRFGVVTYLQPPVLNALFALLRRLPDQGSLELTVQEPKLGRLFRMVGLAGRRKVALLEEEPQEALAA
jgi:hypothetical protein